MFGFGKKRNGTNIGAPLTTAGRSGFGAPLHYQFTPHPLPDPGAMNYSFDTLCLPKYSAIGNGPGVRNMWQYTQGVVYALQGVTLAAIGAPGVLTGQQYSQPLIDPDSNDLPPELQAQLAVYAPGSFRLPGG